jgi:hypothetical protein
LNLIGVVPYPSNCLYQDIHILAVIETVFKRWQMPLKVFYPSFEHRALALACASSGRNKMTGKSACSVEREPAQRGRLCSFHYPALTPSARCA